MLLWKSALCDVTIFTDASPRIVATPSARCSRYHPHFPRDHLTSIFLSALKHVKVTNTFPTPQQFLQAVKWCRLSVKLQRLCDKALCQAAPRESRSNNNDLVMGPVRQWDALWASWWWEVVPWAVAGLEGRTDSRPCLCRLRRCCCCTCRSCCWMAICWAVSWQIERETTTINQVVLI